MCGPCFAGDTINPSINGCTCVYGYGCDEQISIGEQDFVWQVSHIRNSVL